ncbi:tRNA (guanine(10)-N2)-methyltransferase homolog isoform X6 [Hippopotamus amphibius kiboko]|uniref:tRNA (guanine(10)-N2)-methyltransferase homolog isoform X6 n=1 Tax=Hippopotamus amphibius kiboko TaxID=575201 RepID=UPI002595CB2D|nr:tRNA (guanine(10)-N2)-methyltransferase homolog isoform X6 [Hippopotamus amphibius kiboko]
MALPATLNRYLLLMAQEHLEFRLPEIKSLLSLFGGQFTSSQETYGMSPFWILSIPSEDIARNLMKRTVCAKSIFELWGHGKSPEELYSSLKNYPAEKMIADGQRELIESYSVKKRHFIGNTSMDAGLSFIMANHGKVKENDIVFDPFVGTGGLLIASAHFGAYVYGTDIDYNTIHGLGKASRKNQKWRGPDENIRANLRQYGLEKYYLDVLVSDASKPSWRKGTYFDAIITDPPYGIRESTRRTGSQKEIPKGIEKCPESHVPVSLSYHLSDMFFDLLNFAAETLVLGGRLVYWLPVYTPEYTEEMVPWHPCLKLISNCEQKLSSHTSRRLITMEKVKEFENRDQYSHLLSDHFLQYQGHNSFREKYFSGVTKRIAKEEKSSQE